jgi:REP element-mobilizing transposase RayT
LETCQVFSTKEDTNNYRRVYVEGGCYFFTVVLANRKNRLVGIMKEQLHVKYNNWISIG